MKRFISLLFALIVSASLFAFIPAFAAEYASSDSPDPVTDRAGLFTDSQIATMKAKIAEIRNKYGYDLAIVTDVTTGDKDYREFCESFWSDNGYGLGSDERGSLLFINMDPEDRYWVNKAFGGATGIFTDYMIDYIDHDLKVHLNKGLNNDNVDGDFGIGVIKYIDALTLVYQNGGKVPKSSVVDMAGLFTDSQIATMKAKIAEIQDKYGYDLAIVTDVTSNGKTHKTYCEDFWFDNGYGFGDDQKGSVLFICMEPGNRGWWSASFGSLRQVFTEEMINKIDDRLEPYMISGRDNNNAGGEYGRGVINYIDNLAKLYENGGKIPSEWKEPLNFTYPILLAAIVGIIAGFTVVGKQKRKMKTVAKAVRARGYMRDGSFNRRELGDVLVGVTVTKTARSSSSSSGGRSSYSSSGRSSGGGRSF